ncbi:arginase family protein [bacterium]
MFRTVIVKILLAALIFIDLNSYIYCSDSANTLELISVFAKEVKGERNRYGNLPEQNELQKYIDLYRRFKKLDYSTEDMERLKQTVDNAILKSRVISKSNKYKSNEIIVWDGKTNVHELLQDADIVLVGTPDSIGTQRNLGYPGSEKAPESVMNKLFERDLKKYEDLKIVYLGHIKIPKAKNKTTLKNKDGKTVNFPDAIYETYESIKLVVSILLEINPHINFIQIGGDHGLAFPFNAAFASVDQKLGFINCDQHFDTKSPNYGGGRPCGPNSGTSFWYFLENEHTPSQNAAFVGIDCKNKSAKDLEEYVRNKGVTKIFYEQEFKDMKPGEEDKLIEKLLSEVGYGVDAGHLSVCIDVVNKYQAPGCSAPADEKAGLSKSTVLSLAKNAGMNPKFRSLGIFEIIPDLDKEEVTVKLGMSIILEYMNGIKLRKKQDKSFSSHISHTILSSSDVLKNLFFKIFNHGIFASVECTKWIKETMFEIFLKKSNTYKARDIALMFYCA